MRPILFICTTILLSGSALSQKNKQSLSIYSSFLNSGAAITGIGTSGSYESTTGKKVFLLGAEYTRPLNSWLKINGGVEYSDHEIITVARMEGPPFTIFDPVKGHIQLLSIPVYLRIDFLHYIFITSGTVIDFEMKNDVTNNQSGIGITGGLGVKYDFKGSVTIFFQPFYQYHGVVFFNKVNSSEHLLNAGIRTGISYRF